MNAVDNIAWLQNRKNDNIFLILNSIKVPFNKDCFFSI